ncbi:hypothetical protein BVG19_g5147 [[Candida] boidinii]|nr:hypothetical protein BVG19_g5147 [[Candida] boidinii]OWB53685.1 hypothetical protein B5S27_g5292 [[Candida] boidinii]
MGNSVSKSKRSFKNVKPANLMNNIESNNAVKRTTNSNLNKFINENVEYSKKELDQQKDKIQGDIINGIENDRDHDISNKSDYNKSFLEKAISLGIVKIDNSNQNIDNKYNKNHESLVQLNNRKLIEEEYKSLLIKSSSKTSKLTGSSIFKDDTSKRSFGLSDDSNNKNGKGIINESEESELETDAQKLYSNISTRLINSKELTKIIENYKLLKSEQENKDEKNSEKDKESNNIIINTISKNFKIKTGSTKALIDILDQGIIRLPHLIARLPSIPDSFEKLNEVQSNFQTPNSTDSRLGRVTNKERQDIFNQAMGTTNPNARDTFIIVDEDRINAFNEYQLSKRVEKQQQQQQQQQQQNKEKETPIRKVAHPTNDLLKENKNEIRQSRKESVDQDSDSLQDLLRSNREHKRDNDETHTKEVNPNDVLLESLEELFGNKATQTTKPIDGSGVSNTNNSNNNKVRPASLKKQKEVKKFF